VAQQEVFHLIAPCSLEESDSHMMLLYSMATINTRICISVYCDVDNDSKCNTARQK